MKNQEAKGPVEFARIVADIQTGNVVHIDKRPDIRKGVLLTAATATGPMCPLVDASVTYDHACTNREAVVMGEVWLMPPWKRFFLGFRDGNNIDTVAFVAALDRTDIEASGANDLSHDMAIGLLVWSFMGGRITTPDSRVVIAPSVGPLTQMMFELDADGRLIRYGSVPLLSDEWADEQMINRSGIDEPTLFATAHTLNLLNMRNVTIAPKAVSRAERRREERLGIRTNVIVVTPNGTSTRSTKSSGESAAVPLHSVRGHAAHYGACCPWHEPKGLLFGKYTGRVWVPQHARGDGSVGEVEQRFVTAR